MSIVLDGTLGITAPDVTTDDGDVYAKGNILGTVSESSGVPTGAIIESGSNANGEFVKYADGTMICTGRVTESRSSSGVLATLFTMPAAFISTTAYTPLASAFTSRPDNVLQVTTFERTDSTFDVYVDRSNATNTVLYVQAIGRWF
jgi:hypothetical protein